MTVLLIILQIIMWILVGIIGLILILVLLVLFLCAMPIRYKVNGNIGGSADVSAKVSYLLRLVTFSYEYHDGKGISILRIAGIRWRKKKKKPKLKKKEVLKQEVSQVSNPKRKPEPSNSNIKPDIKEEKPEGILQKIKNIINKIKTVLTYPQGKTIIKLVYVALRKLGKLIWPKYLRISGEVGFADPSQTGLFVGAYEGIAGALGLRHAICLTGDFTAESTVVCLDIAARGSTSILRLSIPIIWLLLKKPIRTLIKDLL
ncbi:MAG: hypothetical protein FWE05_04430 [Defluviitaleaceae bacterium]|nr:hypothetical protein [Defluviitaleaceae bacterium]